MSPAELKKSEMTEEERLKNEHRNKGRLAVMRVLETPEKLRALVADGKEDEGSDGIYGEQA